MAGNVLPNSTNLGMAIHGSLIRYGHRLKRESFDSTLYTEHENTRLVVISELLMTGLDFAHVIISAILLQFFQHHINIVIGHYL